MNQLPSLKHDNCAHLIFSRPGRSQGLLYKQSCHSLTDLFSNPFPPTALQCCQAQMIKDSSSSYKIDYVIMIKNFLNPNGPELLESPKLLGGGGGKSPPPPPTSYQ